MTMTRFRIHIGAHKTATTHVQDSLFQASKTLEAQKILYIPRHEFRKKKINSQIAPTSHDRAISAYNHFSFAELIHKNSELFKTIIISEENIIGSSYDLLNNLYPEARPRLARWKFMSKQEDVEIFLSIRNYKDILPSAYAQALRDGTRPPRFENILEYWINARPSWLRLVQAAVEFFGKSKVTVWTFETYLQNPNRILRELSGVELCGIDLDKSDQNRRLSAASVAKMEKIDRSLPFQERLKQIRDIEQGGDAGPYDPICKSDTEILSLRYDQDCDAIRALGVKFID